MFVPEINFERCNIFFIKKKKKKKKNTTLKLKIKAEQNRLVVSLFL